MAITVEAQKRRELGKNASRRLRAEGSIPAVIYGLEGDSIPVAVAPQDLLDILRSRTGRNTIFEVSTGKGSEAVVIRDYQLDPIRHKLVHVDLLRVDMSEKMEFDVPIHFVGTPKGISEGGILEVIMRELPIECLPGDVPEHFEAEVSHLEMGSDPLTVADLEIDREKIEVLVPDEKALATVAMPTTLAAIEEEAEEAEEMMEPEIVGAEEEEAAPEGEEEAKEGEGREE